MKKITLTLSLIPLVLAGAALAAPGGMGMQMKDPMGDKTVTRADAEAKAGEAFARLDANGDGKLDQADHETRQLERFSKVDTDGNGSISKDEFLAASKAGAEKAGKARAAKTAAAGKDRGRMGQKGMGAGPGMMMRMADADKDGAISKDEFTSSMLRRFDQSDANKDGKVTPEERKAARAAMHARMQERKKAN